MWLSFEVRVWVRVGGSVPIQSNHGEWVNILATTCMPKKYSLVVSVQCNQNTLYI